MLTCTRTNNQCEKAYKHDSGAITCDDQWCKKNEQSINVALHYCIRCGRQYGIALGKAVDTGLCPECEKKQSTGRKDDNGKRQWHLMPYDALEEVVKVLEFGADKYGEFNWKQVDNYTERYMDAAMRHLIAYSNGELRDDESGLSHAAHLACNALFLLWKELSLKDCTKCSNWLPSSKKCCYDYKMNSEECIRC